MSSVSKSPNVPVHLSPVDAPQVIRYIGHPDLETNRQYLAPWATRVNDWIREGQPPFVFMHMPDNGDALALAVLWNELLGEQMPEAGALRLDEKRPQLGLF